MRWGRDRGECKKPNSSPPPPPAAAAAAAASPPDVIEEFAAEMFALVVFVSDGLLQVTHQDQSTPSLAARFLAMAVRLPLELQMVLCHRVVGSAKESILGRDSEPAFRNLARPKMFTWEQYLSFLGTVPNEPSDDPFSFAEMVIGVHFGTPEEQILSTSRFRKMVTNGSHQHIGEVIAAGVIPKLVEFLSWALGNIAGDGPKYRDIVLNSGALPPPPPAPPET